MGACWGGTARWAARKSEDEEGAGASGAAVLQRFCSAERLSHHAITAAGPALHPCSLPFLQEQVHLFDIDIPGKITFKESLTLSPGQGLTVVDTEASVFVCARWQGTCGHIVAQD